MIHNGAYHRFIPLMPQPFGFYIANGKTGCPVSAATRAREGVQAGCIRTLLQSRRQQMERRPPARRVPRLGTNEPGQRPARVPNRFQPFPRPAIFLSQIFLSQVFSAALTPSAATPSTRPPLHPPQKSSSNQTGVWDGRPGGWWGAVPVRKHLRARHSPPHQPSATS